MECERKSEPRLASSGLFCYNHPYVLKHLQKVMLFATENGAVTVRTIDSAYMRKKGDGSGP